MELHQLGNEGNSSGEIHTEGNSSIAEKNARLAKYRRDRRLNPDIAANERAIRASWREKNRQKLQDQQRSWVSVNRERRRASARKFSANRTPEQIEKDKAYQAEYRAKTAEKKKRYMADWTKRNKPILKQKAKAYLPRRYAINRHKRATDPIQRLKDACRTRVGFILRKAGIAKFDHTFALIGCTPDFFKAYLTAKFKPGMSWNNFGEWEIDHIRPLAAFNLAFESEKFAAFHYSNCQPLWKIENRMKNDTLPGSHQPSLI